MAIKIESYAWFMYKGRKVAFHTGHAEHDLHLFSGEVFGYKKWRGRHFIVDKTELEIRFELTEKDAMRVIANSVGWSGKINKVGVQAGVGGLDNPVEEKDTKDVHHLQIDSSNLTAAFYDKKAKVLTVTFHNGATWEYHNVTAKEARDLENAESQGRYFIYKIRSTKPQNKVK